MRDTGLLASQSSTDRAAPQVDQPVLCQIEPRGENASVQVELRFEFSRRQQAADGVDVL